MRVAHLSSIWVHSEGQTYMIVNIFSIALLLIASNLRIYYMKKTRFSANRKEMALSHKGLESIHWHFLFLRVLVMLRHKSTTFCAVHMDWRVEIQSCWCERLARGMAQLRHIATTLSHPYKTNITSEPMLTIPAGLGSKSDLAQMACSHDRLKSCKINFCERLVEGMVSSCQYAADPSHHHTAWTEVHIRKAIFSWGTLELERWKNI